MRITFVAIFILQSKGYYWGVAGVKQAAAPVDEMQSLLLAAEADDELDELIGAKRRSGRLVAVVSLLIILISLGVIGWVVTRRAAPAETGAAAADDGAAGEVDAPP